MTTQLDIVRDGPLGVIALNRPEAINALSLEMIEGITRTLLQWQDVPALRVVLFEGRGPRGFCAGGDVRWVRQAILDGRGEDADAYFAAEYRMNALIAAYPKPLVALTHGVVMGGGIGIAGHCRYRFTLDGAKFAMPEAAIGFVADVGVNRILGKVPLHRALLFLMSGIAVGAADARELGLVDAVCNPEHREAIRVAIGIASSAPDPDLALRELVQSESVAAGEPVFCIEADLVAAYDVDWQSAESIVAATAGRLADTLNSRSPTSLEAIVQSHLAARYLSSTPEVLALDLRLAKMLARMPDFAEGVRAVLVDKDQKPAWTPKEFAAVARQVIAATILPPLELNRAES
ncbi:enoyl-CoA hydratase/isomerase family protein [Devosia sp.]|uniref:enoyl-CoA hydratase/isomerase family protein n=1 Tax=Devosia sp. TaxID=1871048 RepID=UPI003BAAA964